MHMHKCGFGMGGTLGLLYGEPKEGGCDYVWEHPDKIPGSPNDDVAHFCPSCGLGPWSLKYMPKTCEEKHVPFVVPAFVGQDEPEKQRAFCEAAETEREVNSFYKFIEQIAAPGNVLRYRR